MQVAVFSDIHANLPAFEAILRDSDEVGDQYVKLRVMLPERPDQELRDFVENWSRSHGYDPRRKAGMT